MDYSSLASEAQVKSTVKNLEAKGYNVVVVATGSEALDHIKSQIPAGVSVMHGSSVTLEQIGFMDHLKTGEHGWEDLHANINAEDDQEKRGKLRRASVLSDYYLGSVYALSEDGEMMFASNTGSQLPHVAFTSPNLVTVISTKKIVADMSAGMQRLESHVIPLENAHMQDLYKMDTTLNKILIFKGESPMIGRKVSIILVKEDLGY